MNNVAFWIVIAFLLILLAGCFGVWVGWGLGEEHANQEHDEWEQAKLRAAMMVSRNPVWRPRELSPPEVAHEWRQHEQEALQLAGHANADLTDSGFTSHMAAEVARGMEIVDRILRGEEP